jgi:hypothetical protein
VPTRNSRCTVKLAHTPGGACLALASQPTELCPAENCRAREQLPAVKRRGGNRTSCSQTRQPRSGPAAPGVRLLQSCTERKKRTKSHRWGCSPCEQEPRTERWEQTRPPDAGIATMGGIAMVDGIATTGGLATADGLQTAGGQYILTGPQSILATEEPAMLVTVLAVRRRRSRGGARGAARRSYSARGAHSGTSLSALRRTGGHSGRTEPLCQPHDGPADGRRRRTRDETEGRLSTRVSRRFQRFGNAAHSCRGDETFPFSLLIVSCKNYSSADMAPHLMCIKHPMKSH